MNPDRFVQLRYLTAKDFKDTDGQPVRIGTPLASIFRVVRVDSDKGVYFIMPCTDYPEGKRVRYLEGLKLELANK